MTHWLHVLVCFCVVPSKYVSRLPSWWWKCITSCQHHVNSSSSKLGQTLPRFWSPVITVGGVQDARPWNGPFSRTSITPYFGCVVCCYCADVQDGTCNTKLDFFLCSLSHHRVFGASASMYDLQAPSTGNRPFPSFSSLPLCLAPFEPHSHPFIPLGRRLAPPGPCWAV